MSKNTAHTVDINSNDRKISKKGQSSGLFSRLWREFIKIAIFKVRFADLILRPLSLLAIRIYIGLIFWRSGQTKFTYEDGVFDTTPAQSLFDFEYIPNWQENATKTIFGHDITFPVPDTIFAANSATFFEVILSVMLIAGFGARSAAFGLLIISAVIELFVYPGTKEHIYWMLALGAVIGMGPGLLSVDALIRRRFMKYPEK